MLKYGESKTTRIMMATVPHVTFGSGLRKFEADGFVFDRLYRRLAGPQGRSGQVRKISPAQGFDPQTLQPVGSRYTDYPIRNAAVCSNNMQKPNRSSHNMVKSSNRFSMSQCKYCVRVGTSVYLTALSNVWVV